jgi:3-hydroxybutyryl-CoA dehydrogenase
MTNQVVGVIGAGVMGTGVAQSLAMAGDRAILIDISDEILDRARTEISQNLRFQGLFKKGEKRVDAREIIGLIEFTTEQRLLSEADFVIENVTEKWDIKKRFTSRSMPSARSTAFSRQILLQSRSRALRRLHAALRRCWAFTL